MLPSTRENFSTFLLLFFGGWAHCTLVHIMCTNISKRALIDIFILWYERMRKNYVQLFKFTTWAYIYICFDRLTSLWFWRSYIIYISLLESLFCLFVCVLLMCVLYSFLNDMKSRLLTLLSFIPYKYTHQTKNKYNTDQQPSNTNQNQTVPPHTAREWSPLVHKQSV